MYMPLPLSYKRGLCTILQRPEPLALSRCWSTAALDSMRAATAGNSQQAALPCGSLTAPRTAAAASTCAAMAAQGSARGWGQQDLSAAAEEEAGCIVRAAGRAAPARTTRASARASAAASAAAAAGGTAEDAGGASCENDAGSANAAVQPQNAPKTAPSRRARPSAKAPVQAKVKACDTLRGETADVTAALEGLALGPGCQEEQGKVHVQAARCSSSAATPRRLATPEPCSSSPDTATSSAAGVPMAEATPKPSRTNVAEATPQPSRARTDSRFAGMQGGGAPMTQAPDHARRRQAAVPLTVLPPARQNRRVAFAATPDQARLDGGCAPGRIARRAMTGVRRERLPPSGAKSRDGAGGVSEDSRTPFVLRRKAGLPSLDEAGEAAVGNLGARMRALGLGQDRPPGAASKDIDGAEEEEGMDRGPVLLVLDGHLQSLPWESLPQLRSQR